MSLVTSLRLQTKHELLYSDKVVPLQCRLSVMNEIRAFQATDHNKFHGIVVDRLLSGHEPDHVCSRGTSKIAPFVPPAVRNLPLQTIYNEPLYDARF